MIYWIKRKYRQISTILWWIPKIWNNYDFDYGYSIKMMVHQLGRQADYLESKNAHTQSSKHNAAKIRLFINLYNKVDDEYYASEYQRVLKETHGDLFDFIIDDKHGSFLKYRYETLGFSDKHNERLNDLHTEEFKKSVKKQLRAHKLLWVFFEHNVKYWWD